MLIFLPTIFPPQTALLKYDYMIYEIYIYIYIYIYICLLTVIMEDIKYEVFVNRF